ncbi:protein translocase subunit SecD [Gemmatimonadota bacterium]
MLKTLRGRLIVIVALIAVSLGYLYSNQQRYGRALKLGLDLQGGMHLVLEVDDPDGTYTAEAKADHIDRSERIIRMRIDEFGVEEPLIQKIGSERLIIELPGISDEERAKDIIRQNAYLEWRLVRTVAEMDPALSRLDRAVVAALGEDSIRGMGRDTEAPTESLEQLLFGGDTLSADTTEATEAATVPAQDSLAEQETVLRPFTGLLMQGDVEGAYLVATEDVETAQTFIELPSVERAMPRDLSLVWGETIGRGARTYRRLYILEEDPFITGDMLESATAGRDPQYNQVEVSFELNRRGGRRFQEISGQHIGDFLAIVLDNEVMSAPVIRDRIGARGRIEMAGSTIEEARDLALVLRAGALTAPLRIMEERTVGPSLGDDSISKGTTAFLVGLVLVLAIMVAYYRAAGILAVFALGIYVILVLGGLAAINATLTLPGIAGLILSVGMAVDANVLIFERVREEVALGRATRTAVDDGFANALSAIVDANLTTLITALILFQFGTGPIRGFAITLSIGIVASFFSAIFVTKTFFLLYLSRKKTSDAISI